MTELTKEQIDQRVAKNVAALFNDARSTCVINLGVGIPTLVSNYITNENIYIHAENGLLGVGGLAGEQEAHPDLINASRQSVLETAGCSYFDSALSFGLIRGGHVDASVLGAFEVDESANVANWIIPGGSQLGVGGAMDLVSGAKRVIIAMAHTNKGKAKIIRRCTLPITGLGEVDDIVTEMAVFTFLQGKLLLRKIAPDVTLEDVRACTEARFDIAENPETMIA
jgi:3-oxoacid CoA-transferase B subunit